MPTLVSVFGVEPFRIGGTETYARELSLQLDRCGWKSVLCFLTPPAAEVREFLEAGNVSIEVLDRDVGFNRTAIQKMSAILRKYQPEILHLHYTGLLSPYPWLARWHAVKQVFFTDHASQPAAHVPTRATWWKRVVARTINWPMTRVICVSNYGHKCFTARDLVPANRCQMIYNGVDLTRVHEDPERGSRFRERFKIPAKRKVVLQVSWIIPEKGIPDLMSAARKVIAQDPNVHFVLVGEGNFRGEYMSAAQEMGIGENITWTGLLADPFTEGAYDAADVVCQVSRWEEVFGWVIAEAMAYRKPIIATRVGGIPELISNGESGYLIERGDVDQLTQKILELVNNDSERARMGEVGARKVKDSFALRKNVSQLIESYGIRMSDKQMSDML
jgi:glycosyltransferase involved in cell wall biosynthesis